MLDKHARAQQFAAKVSLSAMIPLLALALLFTAYDYGNRRAFTDTTAKVIYQGFSSPKPPSDSIYLLVLKRNNKVWKVHVPKHYFYSVRENTRVLLTRFVGPISGYAWDIQLRIASENYYETYRAEILKTAPLKQ